MGDSHSPPPLRKSERTAKRPHHLRDFVIDENGEPDRKTPRLQTNKLHHTTLQNENEQMALEAIEKLIGSLSTSQQLAFDKIESNNTEMMKQLKTMDTKVSETFDLVKTTREELTNKIDQVQQPSTRAERVETTQEAEQLKSIEVLVSKLAQLVNETRSELNIKIDKLQHPSNELHNTVEVQHTQQSSAPLTRSTSNTSINSVESVEQITRQISQSISTALGSHKKLIALPKFNGEADRWPQFIAQFNLTTKREQYGGQRHSIRTSP